MNIYPSILFNSGQEAEEWIKRAAETGKCSRMQVDFVDDAFTDRLAIEVEGFAYIKNYSNINFDAHLMVTEKNIAKYIKNCQLHGFDRIIVQMESVSNPEKYKSLSIDIHSPIQAIEPYLKNLEYINIMSIEPGFGGQEFMDKVTEKISLVSKIRQISQYKYKICVDGGVEKDILLELEKLGVDEVVVGVKRLLQW